MKEILLTHEMLRKMVRFTDPFIHSMEKEEEILSYFKRGDLRPPSLVEHGGRLLIFNGNHRVLVAINRELTIPCIVLENLADVHAAQASEGARDRDISMVSPLSFEGVIEQLFASAETYGSVDPSDYSY